MNHQTSLRVVSLLALAVVAFLGHHQTEAQSSGSTSGLGVFALLARVPAEHSQRMTAFVGKISGVLTERVAFADFTMLFGKRYSNQEESSRRESIFETRLTSIIAHNTAFNHRKHTWHMGINEFSDLSDDEIRQRMTGYQSVETQQPQGGHVRRKRQLKIIDRLTGGRTGSRSGSSGGASPKADNSTCLDWRDEGVVTKPKNQGGCGSCWSFVTTGMLESYYAIQNKKASKPMNIKLLSEQHLVDCTNKTTSEYGSSGCKGGHAFYSWGYIQKGKGINTETCYPYEGRDDKKCRPVEGCNHDTSVKLGDKDYRSNMAEADIVKMVQSQGPLFISLQTSSNFNQYK